MKKLLSIFLLLSIVTLPGCFWGTQIETRTEYKVPPEDLLLPVHWPELRVFEDGSSMEEWIWQYIYGLEGELTVQKSAYDEYQTWRQKAIETNEKLRED